MSLATGSHVGPYEIVGRIGAGGMGEVFRARDARLGRDVALKIVPAAFAADPDRLRRFEREARAAAALNHPNILAVYDVGTTNGVSYVVSEALDGRTLRQVLEGGALPTRKAIEYATQIASGLAAAHEKGIVHRDIKPENIFVTKDGRIKVLDFGLAKLAESAIPGVGNTVTETQPGVVLGTVGYMSPEQLRGEAVDARSDIFSFGAVLYEMFAGQRAFKGESSVETMTAILTGDPPDFAAAAPGIERLVRRCLEKHADERFQSVRDIAFALEAVSSVSGSTKPAVTESVPRTGVSRMRVIAIAAVVAFLTVAGTWLATRVAVAATGTAEITQLTFRNGTIRNARFAPDGQNVLYAAAWEGQPIKLFSTRPDSPDSTALSLSDADLMAVSRGTNELLATLGAAPAFSFYTRGTLARASIAGGAPRLITQDVIAADVTADGQSLAAIVAIPNGGFSLQFPIGVERLKTPYPISDLRIAPNGEQLAFLSHPLDGDDGGDVKVLGKIGGPRTISSRWLSVGGLAWADQGRELWFTATRKGGIRALWAVTLDGRERQLYRSTERLTLQDVAADGRALVSAGTIRSRTYYAAVHDSTVDRDLSWFDFDSVPSISADGKVVAFTESGEGTGAKYGLFVRPAAGGPAVRVADAAGGVISPDGTRVFGIDLQDPAVAMVVPTGTGPVKRLSLRPLEQTTVWNWYPDKQHLIVVGNEPGHGLRSWRLDSTTGDLRAVTPEGATGVVLSPDGAFLAIWGRRDRYLLDLKTGAHIPVKDVERADGLLGFVADGSALYVTNFDPQGFRIFRVALTSGKRTLLREVHPSEAGFVSASSSNLSFDGEHFAYCVITMSSQLFLLKLPQ